MEKLVIVVHVLAALSIIGLILLQQGKGATMGASFGAGASQTMFGGQGSGGFFARATALVAVIFFATSFGLAVIAKQKATLGDDIGIPGLEDSEVPSVQQPEESDVPSVNGDSQPQSEGEVPSVPNTNDGADAGEAEQ